MNYSEEEKQKLIETIKRMLNADADIILMAREGSHVVGAVRGKPEHLAGCVLSIMEDEPSMYMVFKVACNRFERQLKEAGKLRGEFEISQGD